MLPQTNNPWVVNAFAWLFYCWNWGDAEGKATNICLDKIWVGNLAGAFDIHLLQSLGITHVVSITQFGDAVQFFPQVFQYCTVELQDDLQSDILSVLPRMIHFMHTAVQAGGRVFLHCNFGRSRSVTVMAAYLMVYYQMTATEAIHYIQALRPIAEPNPHFTLQLHQWQQQPKTIDA
jgi:hypothetical protein